MIRQTRHLAITFLLSMATRADAAPFDLIVCGQGGDPNYSASFQDWGLRLRSVLIETLDHSPNHVILLTESGSDANGTSDRATILRRLAELRTRVSPDDDLFIYLIGHGTYRQSARFNVAGPDLTAQDLAVAVASVPGPITLINAASASAPFVRVLSGPNRVICTSTKGAGENNATRFAEYFIQGLVDLSADRNRDDRISILEACRHASALTAASYAAEGILSTEHALIDSEGQSRGVRLDGERGLDDLPAGRVFLKDWSFPKSVPDGWIEDYRVAVDSVEGWIGRKETAAEASYWKELEQRLIRAAIAHRRIRQWKE